MNNSLTDCTERTMAKQARSDHFAFCGPGGSVRAGQTVRPVAPGRADTLESRLAQALRDGTPDAVIGGALPFRRGDEDCLWCADEPVFRPDTVRPVPHFQDGATLHPEAAPGQYGEAVAEALRLMQSGTTDEAPLRKIVLARTLAVTTSRPIPPEQLMAQLGEDPAITAFRVALPHGAGQAAARWLVGATPELLLEKRGGQILSYPLAGSARRSNDPMVDAAACSDLAQSDKDRREHAMVVEYILDTLAPWCRNLGCPDGTGLTCTRSMWHLGTRITGELRDDQVPSVVLAAALHPTPAVCGLPRDRAATLIDQLEPVARDYYAGAVGWCDSRGDGAWQVAIRCAELAGNRARLFAGAGIVPGSCPKAETAETGSKFAALLRAFGLPADAALQLDKAARLEDAA